MFKLWDVIENRIFRGHILVIILIGHLCGNLSNMPFFAFSLFGEFNKNSRLAPHHILIPQNIEIPGAYFNTQKMRKLFKS